MGHAKADISSIGLGMDDVISTLEMFAMEAASVTDSLIAHGANSTVVNKLASMAPSLPDKLRGFLNGTREAIAVVGAGARDAPWQPHLRAVPRREGQNAEGL